MNKLLLDLHNQQLLYQTLRLSLSYQELIRSGSGAHPSLRMKLDNFNQYWNYYLQKFDRSQLEIVVARYNEDIHWTSSVRHLCHFYNKGNKKLKVKNSVKVDKLPNIGRESHTYLTHIINNWDSLAEKTLFTQGTMSDLHYPFPVSYYLLSPETMVINLRENNITFRDYEGGHFKHAKKWKKEYDQGLMKPAKYSFKLWFNHFVDTEKNLPKDCQIGKLKWSHGAIFSVSRELIKQHPLSYYRDLLSTINDHINPEEGHYFERSWYYIFYQVPNV